MWESVRSGSFSCCFLKLHKSPFVHKMCEWFNPSSQRCKTKNNTNYSVFQYFWACFQFCGIHPNCIPLCTAGPSKRQIWLASDQRWNLVLCSGFTLCASCLLRVTESIPWSSSFISKTQTTWEECYSCYFNLSPKCVFLFMDLIPPLDTETMKQCLHINLLQSGKRVDSNLFYPFWCKKRYQFKCTYTLVILKHFSTLRANFLDWYFLNFPQKETKICKIKKIG